MTPPVLFTLPPPFPVKRRMPPFVACIVAWLRKESATGAASIVNVPPVRFALTRPRFVRCIVFSPTWPIPEIV
jgi:hypothetical protein